MSNQEQNRIIAASMLTSKTPKTKAERIARAKNDIRTVNTEDSEILSLAFSILDFYETGRPIDDFNALKLAMRSYKRNL